MHAHILGGSGFGKSKLIEYFCRDKYPKPFAVFDWHGTLYRDLLSFFAYLRPNRQVYLLDPSQDEWIAGFNPFLDTGFEQTVQVNRRIASVLKPWGGDSNEMPTFERMMRLVFTFAVEHRASLPLAARLLEFGNAPFRRWVAQNTKDPYARSQWELLLEIKTYREWEQHVLSSENRLSRFLGSRSIRRHFSIRQSLNIRQIMEENAVLLVNLGYSEHLDRDSARVFATLLLSEFFEAAMMRAGTSKDYTLVLDECHEYLTDDIPAILTETRKGGLSLWLSHQNLDQLPRGSIRGAVVSIPTRYVMGGLSTSHASEVAHELRVEKELIQALQPREAYQRVRGETTLITVPDVIPIPLTSRRVGEYAAEIASRFSVSGEVADEEYRREEAEYFGRTKKTVAFTKTLTKSR